jgi:arginase
MARTPTVTTYAGPAGDHNDRAMRASTLVGEALARRLGVPAQVVGDPVTADPQGWRVELERARSALSLMRQRTDQVLARGWLPVAATTRCAVSLATQPTILRHRPDAVVVWLDAHGDINTPDDTATGYLGGMALSGALGWWDAGLDAGPADSRAILVGARDLDPAERMRVEAGDVTVVYAGPAIGDRLAEVIAGRPVSFHLDCDVLEPGLVATDYQVPNGLTLEDLHACAEAAALSEVVGVEVSEFEGTAQASAKNLLDALDPLLG